MKLAVHTLGFKAKRSKNKRSTTRKEFSMGVDESAFVNSTSEGESVENARMASSIDYPRARILNIYSREESEEEGPPKQEAGEELRPIWGKQTIDAAMDTEYNQGERERSAGGKNVGNKCLIMIPSAVEYKQRITSGGSKYRVNLCSPKSVGRKRKKEFVESPTSTRQAFNLTAPEGIAHALQPRGTGEYTESTPEGGEDSREGEGKSQEDIDRDRERDREPQEIKVEEGTITTLQNSPPKPPQPRQRAAKQSVILKSLSPKPLNHPNLILHSLQRRLVPSTMSLSLGHGARGSYLPQRMRGLPRNILQKNDPTFKQLYLRIKDIIEQNRLKHSRLLESMSVCNAYDMVTDPDTGAKFIGKLMEKESAEYPNPQILESSGSQTNLTNSYLNSPRDDIRMKSKQGEHREHGEGAMEEIPHTHNPHPDPQAPSSPGSSSLVSTYRSATTHQLRGQQKLESIPPSQRQPAYKFSRVVHRKQSTDQQVYADSPTEPYTSVDSVIDQMIKNGELADTSITLRDLQGDDLHPRGRVKSKEYGQSPHDIGSVHPLVGLRDQYGGENMGNMGSIGNIGNINPSSSTMTSPHGPHGPNGPQGLPELKIVSPNKMFSRHLYRINKREMGITCRKLRNFKNKTFETNRQLCNSVPAERSRKERMEYKKRIQSIICKRVEENTLQIKEQFFNNHPAVHLLQKNIRLIHDNQLLFDYDEFDNMKKFSYQTPKGNPSPLGIIHRGGKRQGKSISITSMVSPIRLRKEFGELSLDGVYTTMPEQPLSEPPLVDSMHSEPWEIKKPEENKGLNIHIINSRMFKGNYTPTHPDIL